MKVNYNTSVPTAHYDFVIYKWYHRDAKRIMRKQEWNSKSYSADEPKEIIGIQQKNDVINYWLTEKIRNFQSGEVRVIPRGEIEIITGINGIGYYKYKLK